MKTNRDHPDYSYLHTKQRMEERYGYEELTVREYKEMCENCTKGTKLKSEYTPMGYQYVYRFMFNDIDIIAVYSSWKKHITTVLPLW